MSLAKSRKTSSIAYKNTDVTKGDVMRDVEKKSEVESQVNEQVFDSIAETARRSHCLRAD
jgi:hypothetical protein